MFQVRSNKKTDAPTLNSRSLGCSTLFMPHLCNEYSGYSV